MGKKRDLAGQRFGKLTVIEDTGTVEDRYVLWRCRCDCGGEALVNTKRLLRGTVKDCGCVPKTNMKRGQTPANLRGMKFGKLTVLEPAEKKGSRTCWLCRCDCGNEHIVTTHDLRRGSVKSCGCEQHLPGKHIADITGQKFGRLTALYPTDKRNAKGSVIWHCACDCGNETDVTQDSLVYGNYRSCGCLLREIKENIPNYLHHIDGTCVEWLEKRKHRSDNTSGFRGVTALPSGKYRVGIGFKKKRFHIGTFATYDEAVAARLEVEELIHTGFVEAYKEWIVQAEADPDWAAEHPLVFEVEKRNGDFYVIRD